MIGTLDTNSREVTIVGAGIAGLLLAYGLDRAGYRVTLMEGARRPGGLIHTRETDYGIAETAAHSLLASPLVAELCRELGVELAEVRRESRARYILRDGRLRKFPLSFGEALGVARRVIFARAGQQADALTLETWGRKHLGGAALDYLLTPFVRGIYGIQPGEVGVGAAFPSLVVPEGRTLLGAMLGKALKGSASKGKKEKGGKRMVAPVRGMSDLVTRLEKHLELRLGERFQRGMAALSLPDAPNVVLATPAYASAALLSAESPALSRALDRVEYTPLVSVTAFVSKDSFTRPVSGVGVLIPAREERKCLGILFNSSAFPGRVFDETRHASFTILLGGSSQPGWVTATDEEIERAVGEELSALLGIRGGTEQLVINRWPRAIPQYSVRLPQVWQQARQTWCAAPGRMLFGNYTGQVSLRGMMESALSTHAAAEEESALGQQRPAFA